MSDKSRETILKWIEEGKISAQEGMELLDELDRKEDRHDWKEDFQEGTERIISSTLKGVSTLMEKVDKGLQKMQDHLDIDFDVTAGRGTEVKETYELTPFQAEQLYFATKNGSLRFITGSGDTARITVSAKAYKVKDEEEARSILKEHLHQKLEENTFSMWVEDNRYLQASMEVTLPERLYQKVHLSAQHGAVRVRDIRATDQHIKTTNASIRMAHIKTGSLHVETSNGRIQLDRVETDAAKLFTTNGSMYMDGTWQDLQGETTNGSIRLTQNGAVASNTSLKTANGSVRVGFPQQTNGVHGKLETSFGQVKCTLSGVDVLDDEESSKERTLSFRQQGELQHRIEVKSTTGSIHIRESAAESVTENE
jgi:DUF4097 and DUF4098 domain-containing protein YvlB